eukprot:7657157-Alexandrium_andersonii.AAC.1
MRRLARLRGVRRGSQIADRAPLPVARPQGQRGPCGGPGQAVLRDLADAGHEGVQGDLREAFQVGVAPRPAGDGSTNGPGNGGWSSTGLAVEGVLGGGQGEC